MTGTHVTHVRWVRFFPSDASIGSVLMTADERDEHRDDHPAAMFVRIEIPVPVPVMTARYDGNVVITDHAPPWILPEWHEVTESMHGPRTVATERTVRRFPRPAEPARWMIRETGARGNWVTWVDVDDRNRTTRTPITYHRQTRTVTPWIDDEPTLPMEATR